MILLNASSESCDGKPEPGDMEANHNNDWQCEMANGVNLAAFFEAWKGKTYRGSNNQQNRTYLRCV
jgi:hypothetical protein